jgi:hypothetical protein
LPVFFDLSRASVVLIGSGAPAIASCAFCARPARMCAGSRKGADSDTISHARHYAGRIEVMRASPMRTTSRAQLAMCSSAEEVDERVARSPRAEHSGQRRRPADLRLHLSAVSIAATSWCAISTGVAPSPVLARRLREKIEAILLRVSANSPPGCATIASGSVNCARGGVSHPSASGKKVIDGPIGAAFLSGRRTRRKRRLLRKFEDAAASNGSGIVHLVGAGPGERIC